MGLDGIGRSIRIWHVVGGDGCGEESGKTGSVTGCLERLVRLVQKLGPLVRLGLMGTLPEGFRRGKDCVPETI